MGRLGVFGGTFDPPHIGHLILASEAQVQLGLERVLWVLTPFPPHKTDRPITPTSYRIEMLKEAIQDNPLFELCLVDIERNPPHYTVDTLALIQTSNPGVDLVYLMGGDSLRDLATWHRPADFIRSCGAIGVMQRPGARIEANILEASLPGVSGKVEFIEAPLVEISATEIRQRVANNRPFRYFVPEAVYNFICDHHLYIGDPSPDLTATEH